MSNDMTLRCPNCKETSVEISIYKEDQGTVTKSKTSSKYKEKGHGCLWWLLIGWWWWIIDAFLWVFMFLPRLVAQLLFHKKKYVGKSKTNTNTVNVIGYRKVCLCKNCGYSWTEEIQ